MTLSILFTDGIQRVKSTRVEPDYIDGIHLAWLFWYSWPTRILFGVFLIMYMIILMGNSLIIIITKMDPSLQTPMYFFLGNFSSLEICYVSVTVPRLLIDLCSQSRNISFLACAAQMYFFLVFGVTECLLLISMAMTGMLPLATHCCTLSLWTAGCVSNWPLAVGSVEFLRT